MITKTYNCAGASVPAGKSNEIPRFEQTGELRNSSMGNEGKLQKLLWENTVRKLS